MSFYSVKCINLAASHRQLDGMQKGLVWKNKNIFVSQSDKCVTEGTGSEMNSQICGYVDVFKILRSIKKMTF